MLFLPCTSIFLYLHYHASCLIGLSLMYDSCMRGIHHKFTLIKIPACMLFLMMQYHKLNSLRKTQNSETHTFLVLLRINFQSYSHNLYFQLVYLLFLKNILWRSKTLAEHVFSFHDRKNDKQINKTTHGRQKMTADKYK